MKNSATNKLLWDNYEQFGRARGRLVAFVLSNVVDLPGAAILDFGCGTGGISLELASRGADVAAFDVNDTRVNILKRKTIKEKLAINIIDQPPSDESQFDVVILLDVIEHLISPDQVLRKLHALLKPGGLLYLSTPNKVAFLNVLVDPHFSLPLVSLLKRDHVKRVVSDWLKWQPGHRIDFPELMILKELNALMRQSKFDWFFVNSTVAAFAFDHPQSVWNRNSHLKIINWLKKMRLTDALTRLISDNIDFFNIWLNPTWYIIAQKSPIPKNEIGLEKIKTRLE